MPSNNYSRYSAKDQRKKRILIELSICTLVFVLALLGIIFKTKLIEFALSYQVKLAPGSAGLQTWLYPPVTTSRSYHLFNITNSLDVTLDPNNERLIVQDTPPYVYNVETKKFNVTWLNKNKQVNYSVERLITRHATKFPSERLNDRGVFLNLLRSIFRTQFGSKPSPAFYVLGKYNPFSNANAVDQLEGFTSELFDTMKDKMVGPNTDKYGFAYRQNGSRLYNVSIETDLKKKGEILAFASELVRFEINSPHEYRFPIYDGLTYPPMLFDKPVLNIFNSDFCKPFLVQFEREITRPDGLKLHEYKLKLINIENCTIPSDTRTCEEVDQLDVSKCVSASLPEKTIFLSKAHFYGSTQDQIDQYNIQGFQPDANKHDSFVYFEPYTGTPCQAVFRLQMNADVIIDPMREIDDGLENLTPANKRGVKRLVPVFWIDQKVDLSQKVIDKLRKLSSIINYITPIFLTLAIVLSIIIVTTMELLARRRAKTVQYTRGTSL